MIVKHSTAEVQTVKEGEEPVWLKKAEEVEEEAKQVKEKRALEEAAANKD